MNKKFKIILSTVTVVLITGYIGLYQWAKNRFSEAHQELTQQLQQEAWTIEQTPLVFSGFPFRLVATQEKFKAVHQNGAIRIHTTDPSKMYVSIFNPLKYSFEGSTILSFGAPTPLFTVTLKEGTMQLHHKDGKLDPVSFQLKNTQINISSPQGQSDLSNRTIQIGILEFEEGEYKITDTNDGKIVQASREYILKDLEVSSSPLDAKTPPFQVKKIKITTKAKTPLDVMEQLKALFKDGGSSAIATVCQVGGKVPSLKSTIERVEKTASYGKINIEAELKDYVLHLDLDAQIKKNLPDLLLVLRVSHLDKLYDALGLDPTVRFIANSFVKKESEKSEKAKLIFKLSDGSVSLNDLQLTKLPMIDWDNITLPADFCSKYKAAIPSTASAL